MIKGTIINKDYLKLVLSATAVILGFPIVVVLIGFWYKLIFYYLGFYLLGLIS